MDLGGGGISGGGGGYLLLTPVMTVHTGRETGGGGRAQTLSPSPLQGSIKLGTVLFLSMVTATGGHKR